MHPEQRKVFQQIVTTNLRPQVSFWIDDLPDDPSKLDQKLVIPPAEEAAQAWAASITPCGGR